MSVDEYLERFDRVNLCQYKWSRVRARIAAVRLCQRTPDYVRVILLGRRVSDSFRIEYEPLTRVDVFLVLPHPSRLSRVWNDPTMMDKTRNFLRGEGVIR